MSCKGTKPLGQDEILMMEYDSVVKQIFNWDLHYWHKSNFFLAIQSVFVIGAFKVLLEGTSSPSVEKPFLFAVAAFFNIYLCVVWFKTNRRSREYMKHRMQRAKDIENDRRLQNVLNTFRSCSKDIVPDSHGSKEWELSIPKVFIVLWVTLLILAAFKFGGFCVCCTCW